MDYILAHDLGTSGNKAVLYDAHGQVKASCVASYQTFYPGFGKVEQDSEQWWAAVCIATKDVMRLANVKAKEIAAVSFSGQMQACLPVDSTGMPLMNAIIWADMRAQTQAEEMIHVIGMEEGYRLTGNRISASYTGAKLLWLKENCPEVFAKTYKILQAKDYIIFRLTGRFGTDFSDASGTNLFDIRKKEWSDDILNELELPIAMLPELHASTEIAGRVTREGAVATGLREGTLVVFGGGDGSCAAVGAGAVKPGIAYNAIGTSSWISVVSSTPFMDPEMRTFNFVHLDSSLYTPLGTMQAAGASLRWAKDTIAGNNIDISYNSMDSMITDVPPCSDGLLFLPYLQGERSPHWDPFLRGAFVGLSVTHSQGHLLRAVEEGVGYNLKIILDIFSSCMQIEKIIAIGGGAKSKVWIKILSDIYKKHVCLPRFLEEATSIGAAICGGVGIGLYSGFDIASQVNPPVEIVLPDEKQSKLYEQYYPIFVEAFQSLAPVCSLLAKNKQMSLT